MKLIKVICTGPENARTRAIIELKQQIFSHIIKRKTEI